VHAVVVGWKPRAIGDVAFVEVVGADVVRADGFGVSARGRLFHKTKIIVLALGLKIARVAI